VDTAGNIGTATGLAFTIDTVAPNVSQVLVGSTAWTQAFKTQLLATSRGNDDGYFILSGADQLDPIWFINANQVAVQFDGPVDVQQTDLLLTGTSASYSIIGFGAGATANTWVWTLSAAIGNDDLTIALDATTGNAVQDTAGNKLDGEWTNVSSSYPSGNGTAGGDFSFRFDVLPGDVNQDRVVNIFDLNYVSSNWGTPGGSPNGDLNGDGVVNIFDINGLSSYWGTSNVDGGNFMMMGGGLSFDAAFAAYLRDIANFRKDKGLLSWLDDNSAEELGQAIEGINSESSPKELDQIQSILDGFFTGLSDYMEIDNELALV